MVSPRSDNSRPSWRWLRITLTVAAVFTGVTVTSVLVLASVWPTINRVETGKTLEYPDLLPKTYQLGFERVYDETLAAVQEQEGWSIQSDDRATGKIVANTAMPVTGWRHTITVRIEKRSEFVTRVCVLSEGHDAPGDLGQNARNIAGLHDALDRRLGAAEVGVTKTAQR